MSTWKPAQGGFRRSCSARAAAEFRERTADGRNIRKTMIAALARMILIALWRYVTTGELPAGVVLKSVAI
jgi:hypothetical protein